MQESIQKQLAAVSAKAGDLIEIKTKTHIVTGILMPHHKFSAPDVITVKLLNGYNVGIRIDDETIIKLVSKSKPSESGVKKITTVQSPLPTVKFIGTGGTIASYVEYRTGAVYPAKTAEELAFSVPELGEICNINAKVLYNIFSEDMKPANWQELAEECAKALNEGMKAVIIPHGTDTLAYTSAALSFMLKNLTGPVILIGAQRSSDRPSSDATMNLLAAARLAVKSDLCEVVVVMHGESSDSFCTILRGTRTRKMHTSRRDAFQPINARPIGKVEGDRIYLGGDYKKKTAEKEPVIADTKLDEKVSLLYFYPGMKPDFFDAISDEYNGFVIAGTGLGHVSTELVAMLKKIVEEGKYVVMCSQCIYGRVNMNVYRTGRELLSAGVLSGMDMLPETAYIKLMWVLGHTKEYGEVKKLMQTNLAGELSEEF